MGGGVQDPDEPVISQGHGEPWLVSYADLMTLLFGFFVLMYTFASENQKDSSFVQVRKELAAFFGGNYTDEFESIGRELGNQLRQSLPSNGRWTLKSTSRGLEIALGTNTLFDLGSADLKTSASKSIFAMAHVIRDNFPEGVSIGVAGHSDDNPISTKQFPSNWELSAARSASVLRAFEKAGLPRDSLRLEAFADTQPVLPNRDSHNRVIAENQARNRRVVITVYRARLD